MSLTVAVMCFAELGVLYWKLNPENYENDSELAKIRDERGYDYMVRACLLSLMFNINGH